jgi:sn-glycerol 3-phosphate transport system permease protein
MRRGDTIAATQLSLTRRYSMVAAVMSATEPKAARRRNWAMNVNAWLLLLPAIVLLATFTHYPILATLYHSFFSLGRSGPAEFIGLENYTYMLEDAVFWQVLRNNFIFALATVPTSIALALKSLGFAGHNWLGDPSTVMTCLAVMVVWKEAGFFMIFYLAALQTIPPELKEAASVEGASRWYFFRRVTLPLLMPTTLFISINALINSFKLVDQLVIMTKGGPNNASSLLLYYIYEVAFNFWDTTYAATLTVTLITILAAVALTKFVYLDRRIHYQ